MNSRQGRTAMLTPVTLLTIAAFLSHLGLGRSTVGHRGPQILQSASWFSRWHPVSDSLEPPGQLVISFSNDDTLLLFFHLFTQVLLLIDGSVEGQYITLLHGDSTSQLKFGIQIFLLSNLDLAKLLIYHQQYHRDSIAVLTKHRGDSDFYLLNVPHVGYIFE